MSESVGFGFFASSAAADISCPDCQFLRDESQNLFQHGIQLDTLAHECQIGEAHLGVGVSHADSLTRLSDKSGPHTQRARNIVCFLGGNDVSRGYRMDIFQSVRQSLHVMSKRAEFLEERIQSINGEIASLGDLPPGAMEL